MESVAVIGGVDTHDALHHAAVLNTVGRRLGDREFAASQSGYDAMLRWMRGFGRLEVVGVEGTGSYGAGLARHLHSAGVKVLEVPRPDRRSRRQRGKSDPVDAEEAARSVLAGNRSTEPKHANGAVESIRTLRVARLGALKANTAAVNTLRSIVITAPEPIRRQLQGLSKGKLVATCRRLRPDLAQLADPVHATKAALRTIAERAASLRHEIDQLEK